MLTRPEFHPIPLELQAEALLALLRGKPASAQKLKPAEQQQVEALAKALRQGRKAEVFKRSQAFFKEVFSPAELSQAYQMVQQMTLQRNPEFEIVMDSLKAQCQSDHPNPPKLSLSDALVQILLAVTFSDKNAIYYERVDEKTGRPRPTTFPLTPVLIQRFLSPFEEVLQDVHKEVLQRAVYIAKNTVMGNPAAELARRYHQRRATYQSALAEYEAAQQSAANNTASPSPSAASQALRQQKVKSAALSVQQLLQETKDPHEQGAVRQSLQPTHFYGLLQARDQGDDSFQQKLSQLYSQRLSASQAQQLSARLASKMKRVLAQMGSWEEHYWDEFQGLMQKLGLWEGSEWLEKWRSHRKGKQALTATAQSHTESEPASDPIAEMLRRQQLMTDKQRGQNMLGLEPDESEHNWLQASSPAISPQMQQVLHALEQKVHFKELIELSACPWQELSEASQQMIYQIFRRYSAQGLPSIKTQVLALAPPEDLGLIREILATLELLINQLVQRLEKIRKGVFADVLEQFKAEQAAIKARDKQRDLAYRRSPAAQYGKYSG
ncbi:MAG: hypothetical protein IGS03_03995 [Candidatus Sericytochromatia bacterium]|nr:hypothetical protein [Candidatus Sericytochromatia bacterium]